MTTTSDPTAPSTTVDGLLTDEMLARFDERAPRSTTARTASSTRTSTSCGRPASSTSPSPPSSAASGSGSTSTRSSLRRLAYVAPATALAVNMHVYWTGVAADLLRNGDDSCRFILEKAAEGEVFAALHGEAGNDMPLLLSSAQAERVDGGWAISGHKIFGSLTPVWTYGGFHAMDTSDPAGPRIVHGFLPRDTPGLEIVDTWDTLGMRATQSQDTILDRAFVPDELVARRVPGRVRRRRAVPRGDLRLGADGLRLRLPRRGAAGVRHHRRQDAQPHVGRPDQLDGAPPARCSTTCRRCGWPTTPPRRCSSAPRATGPAGVAHEDWPVRIVGARQVVINNAFDIVDRALDLSGGAAVFKPNRLEQIFRDVRMGRFHPGNTLLAHELIGKLCLGINPDDPQRWG